MNDEQVGAIRAADRKREHYGIGSNPVGQDLTTADQNMGGPPSSSSPLKLSPASEIRQRISDTRKLQIHLQAALNFLDNDHPTGNQIAEGLASLRFLGYHY